MTESIAVVKDDVADKWLIATNPRITPGGGTDGHQSERGQARLECDFVWTGEFWSSDWEGALRFDDRDAAEMYFRSNVERLSA